MTEPNINPEIRVVKNHELYSTIHDVIECVPLDKDTIMESEFCQFFQPVYNEMDKRMNFLSRLLCRNNFTVDLMLRAHKMRIYSYIIDDKTVATGLTHKGKVVLEAWWTLNPDLKAEDHWDLLFDY